MEPENDLSQEDPKREGPFMIIEVLRLGTYWLQLLTSWKIHNAFHATLLQPYKENETYGENFTEPPRRHLN